VDRRSWTALGIAVGVLLIIGGVVLWIRSTTGEDPGADLSAVATSTDAGVDDGSPGSSTPVEEPTPTGPTMEELQTEWADEFCRSRQALGDAVSGLGGNLDWEFGTDTSVLDQLDQQIRWQVLAIGSAANDLGMLLTKAPVDPTTANDWLVGIAEPAQQAQASVDEVTTNLDAMLSADGLLDGIGKAGEVITSGAQAVAAGQELLTAVQETSDAAQAEFAPAFAAAPSCQNQ